MSDTNFKARLEKFNYYIKNLPPHDYFQKNIWDRTSLISFEHDKCIFEYVVDPKDCNSSGAIHGGFIASLIDIVSTAAILVFQ
ncbi:4009_t:CDS:1, partial [Funneliformis caledonium]